MINIRSLFHNVKKKFLRDRDNNGSQQFIKNCNKFRMNTNKKIFDSCWWCILSNYLIRIPKKTKENIRVNKIMLF